MIYIPRLKAQYDAEFKQAMMDKFNYKNVMEVPKLLKICMNQGVGEGTSDKKLVDAAVQEMTLISGQKAVPTKSRKAISNFKLREFMPIGARVTLRDVRMYDFLDRLVSTALPRVRDFQGLPVKGFDGRGNYNMGVTEQIIFPEINIDKTSRITGMDITFVTNAKTDVECLELLKLFGMPFKTTK
jgi:large subunit ribosomal protein L5